MKAVGAMPAPALAAMAALQMIGFRIDQIAFRGEVGILWLQPQLLQALRLCRGQFTVVHGSIASGAGTFVVVGRSAHAAKFGRAEKDRPARHVFSTIGGGQDGGKIVNKPLEAR